MGCEGDVVFVVVVEAFEEGTAVGAVFNFLFVGVEEFYAHEVAVIGYVEGGYGVFGFADFAAEGAIGAHGGSFVVVVFGFVGGDLHIAEVIVEEAVFDDEVIEGVFFFPFVDVFFGFAEVVGFDLVGVAVFADIMLDALLDGLFDHSREEVLDINPELASALFLEYRDDYELGFALAVDLGHSVFVAEVAEVLLEKALVLVFNFFEFFGGRYVLEVNGLVVWLEEGHSLGFGCLCRRSRVCQ